MQKQNYPINLNYSTIKRKKMDEENFNLQESRKTGENLRIGFKARDLIAFFFFIEKKKVVFLNNFSKKQNLSVNLIE